LKDLAFDTLRPRQSVPERRGDHGMMQTGWTGDWENPLVVKHS
jgi:hypothetical protein